MWWIGGGVVLIVAFALWGPVVSGRVEQPRYDVSRREGPIEIRDYPPLIVAETVVSGDRERSINRGFRILADYIFGDNASSAKVAMTAAVPERAAEKIPMTAPVLQKPMGSLWSVRFVMPAKYSIETLPKPLNPEVTIRLLESERFVVIRFAGTASKASLDQHVGQLQAFIAANALQALSPPTFAFYNPPWTLPPMRRNEVMIEIGHQ